MIRRKEVGGLPGTKVTQTHSPNSSPNRGRSIASSLENTLDGKIEIALHEKAHGLPALKQA